MSASTSGANDQTVAAIVERQVIGALMRGAPAARIREVMPADAFGEPWHQVLADVIYGLAADGAPVTPESVLERMHARGQVERWNLADLISIFRDAPLPHHGLYFAGRARRYADLRRLHVLGEQLVAMSVGDVDDAPDLLREAARRLHAEADRIAAPGHNTNDITTAQIKRGAA
jgi:replicative DNA helicase